MCHSVFKWQNTIQLRKKKKMQEGSSIKRKKNKSHHSMMTLRQWIKLPAVRLGNLWSPRFQKRDGPSVWHLCQVRMKPSPKQHTLLCIHVGNISLVRVFLEVTASELMFREISHSLESRTWVKTGAIIKVVFW